MIVRETPGAALVDGRDGLGGVVAEFSMELAIRKAREVGGLVEAVMRHLFSITWGFFDIIFWKGLWDGYDHLAGSGLMQSLGTTVVGLAILSTTRTMKSATSMPVSSNTEGRGRLIPEFSVP